MNYSTGILWKLMAHWEKKVDLVIDGGSSELEPSTIIGLHEMILLFVRETCEYVNFSGYTPCTLSYNENTDDI